MKNGLQIQSNGHRSATCMFIRNCAQHYGDSYFPGNGWMHVLTWDFPPTHQTLSQICTNKIETGAFTPTVHLCLNHKAA